jgi:drug/metabolite transporter (DMT)-like permease
MDRNGKGETPATGVLWVAAGAALWGVDPVLRQPLASVLPSAHIVLIEHIVIALILVPLLWLRRAQWLALGARDWAAVLGISWGGSAVATMLFTESIKAGNPTSAVFLQKTQPLFAILFARVLLKEKLGSRFWVHAGLGLLGAYMVSFGTQSPFAEVARAQSNAALCAVVAAVLWGMSTALGRFLTGKLTFLTITALRITTALPLLGVMALATAEIQPAGINAKQWLSLLAIALIPGLAALLLYYRGLMRTRASLAAIAELSFPATAALLNWLVLGSRITPVQAAGFVLLCGVILHLRANIPP